MLCKGVRCFIIRYEFRVYKHAVAFAVSDFVAVRESSSNQNSTRFVGMIAY